MVDLVEFAGPGSTAPPVVRQARDSATGAIVVGALAITLFFGGFLGWAAFIPLDGAVTGDGVVTVAGNRKSVAEVDGGTVTSVSVSEGQYVKAGDVLLTLDDSRARSDYEINRQQLVLAEIHLARLKSDLDGGSFISFPTDLMAGSDPFVAQAMADESVDFEARHAATATLQKAIEQQITAINDQITAKQAHLSASSDQLSSLQAEKTDLSNLVAAKVVTHDRWLDLQRSIYQVQAEVADTDADIGALNQSIHQLQQQSQQLDTDRRSQASGDLVTTQAKVLQLQSATLNTRAALNRLRVVAPYEGRIVNLKVFSVGGVVQPGQPLLDIVPSQAPLVIEARLPVDSINDVAPGATTEVRFPAFPEPENGGVTGAVERVSADRLTDDHTGTPYYEASVTIPPETLKRAGVTLSPGMSATVLIHTGSRTALQYLTGPLLDAFATSFRQR